MASDLEQVAQGLIDALDQTPRAAADLRNAANQCMELAGDVAELAVILPEAAAAAEYLAEAARACAEAGQLVSVATVSGRSWAEAAVGPRGPGAGSGSADSPVGRDAAAGSKPQRQAPPVDGGTISGPRQVELDVDLGDLDLGPAAGGEERGRLELSTAEPDHIPALSAPPPNSTVVVDSKFTYRTDELGRVVDAEAVIDLIDLDHPRDPASQRNLIGKLPGDHAGHIFARIFQGPIGTMNLVPMQGNEVNLSRYKAIENHWRKIIEAGGSVEIFVSFTYQASSRRPDLIRVEYRYPGGFRQTTIRNSTTAERGLA